MTSVQLYSLYISIVEEYHKYVLQTWGGGITWRVGVSAIATATAHISMVCQLGPRF